MLIPKLNADGKRFYGRWAGDPRGRAEDDARCIAEVPAPPAWYHVQCSRKRGHGPNGEFCKQHGKKAEAESRR